ncbi:hypothetical protein GCM10009118_07990 [Wandonia haliotis]|uniref:Uncharacterized protein n=1 Tax=Wandonia haliotis TaxID=574963 RepID=A0ABN1MNC8_9FLAO
MGKILPIKPEESESIDDLRKAINHRFKDLDKRFDRYEQHFNQLHLKIDGVKTLLDTVHSGLIQRIGNVQSDTSSLELKVSSLESRFNEFGEKLDRVLKWVEEQSDKGNED